VAELSAPTPTRESRPAPSSRPAAAAPQPIGATVDADKGPVGPGFSIADVGRPTPAASSAAPSTAASAPLASLAQIIGSIEIPAEELSRPDNAIGADTLARLLEDKRKAEAAEAAKREK